jgi:histone deacetylase HOS3
MKHNFSRNVKPRELALIVERPERCRASILGIAAAKSRLAIEESLDLSFDIVKSNRLGNLSDPAVTDVHGAVWPVELSALCDNAVETLAKGDLEIPAPYHSGDLYLGEGSHEALRGCIGAVYDGVDRVLADDYDRVHVSVRPPGHHCAETMPSGFCMINNVHVALAYAHRKYGITRAAILDFDLHHGDGSQAITWSINEKTNQLGQTSRSPRHNSVTPGLRVAYFSLHDIYSFPVKMVPRTKFKMRVSASVPRPNDLEMFTYVIMPPNQHLTKSTTLNTQFFSNGPRDF